MGAVLLPGVFKCYFAVFGPRWHPGFESGAVQSCGALAAIAPEQCDREGLARGVEIKLATGVRLI